MRKAPTPPIAGRVFFLTGAASGIGERLATRLAEGGAQVYATDANRDGLEAAAARHAWPPAKVALAPLDVRDYAAWERAVEAAQTRFGPIDVLMNVAGVATSGLLQETDATEIDRLIDINTKGLMYGCRAVAPHLAARGAGHIVNMGSMASLVSVPAMSLYVASKHAVRGFSHTLAEDLRPHGVAVTLVCPDAVHTPMLVRQAANEASLHNFMGLKLLELEEVERLILGRVLRRRPLEANLPWTSALVAKLGGALPALGSRLFPLFRRSAVKNRARYLARLAAARETEATD
mgnify:CR=1 FL=1